MLFIGVGDAGDVVGLDGDLKLAKGQNEDGLRLRFDDLVKTYLGNQLLPLLTVHSLQEDGSLYWALEIKPTIEPVYVKNNGDDEFWIRGMSSSRKLSTRETVDYIENRRKQSASIEHSEKRDEVS
ncbi:MAG: hypothetical protein D5R96_03335 [Methanocalculus sp. MSAO_Arc2]|nr:MAG: hypothetical protein D5R96_03335 [Methanocalculus sp. MSAO_Arc2]